MIVFFNQVDQVMKPVFNNSESEDESEIRNAQQLRPINIENIQTTEIGGIDLHNVKTTLGKEDRHDRKAERERVKRKHKEARKKVRKGRQAESNAVMAFLYIILLMLNHVYLVYYYQNIRNLVLYTLGSSIVSKSLLFLIDFH